MHRALLVVVTCAFVARGQQALEPAHLQFARSVFRDAVTSARMVNSRSGRDFAVSEIAEAQARSDFLSDAISTTALVSEHQDVLLINVASIEARRGEYQSAMKAVEGKSRFTQDRVRVEIGIEQARRGDVHAALMTADSMDDGYDKEQVLYFACLELLRQGDRAGAEQVGLRLKSPDHALPKESDVEPTFDWRKPSPPPVPKNATGVRCYHCEALSQLQAGKIAEAVSSVEADPNPADVASNLARLAGEAADLGNLDAALRFADNRHLSGTRYEEDYLVGALGRIGQLWATVDRSAALKWAGTRPTMYQRAVALAGVAEGVATAHERPLH